MFSAHSEVCGEGAPVIEQEVFLGWLRGCHDLMVSMKCLAEITELVRKRGKQHLPGLPGIISPGNLAEEARVLTSQARLAGLLSEYDDLLAPAIVLDELETCHGSVIWDMDTLSISFRKVRAALREWSNASITLNTGNID
ncbi:hypothetical protein IEO21_09283 [Rhodonia placenta]|uniref:Uncharacterized protein n=1 Tax=Rhodonia placenta TaxID=104341 RepID=A0A8H7NUS9_9APHY|nr:hypothetical protein IEO21_09283 [Postia placenta]